MATPAEAIFACRPNLLVSDLATSLRFYRELLGFRVGWRWSGRPGRFLAEDGRPDTALVGRGQAQVLLTQFAGGHAAWPHFDVHTQGQVDDLFAEQTARGARIAEPPVLRV
ncbi:MAG TPA: VOC family protein [Pseudonocardiaceae bacterium]|jgi:catechol 2,3-dioxygenase-like lactoylglutathione lyase family enzyme|nr:VOC family protein [Pseudonocardiaceae bacterium]